MPYLGVRGDQLGILGSGVSKADHGDPAAGTDLAVPGSVGGLVGIGIGLGILVVHLAKLKSLGVPYLVFAEPSILLGRLKSDKFRSARLRATDRRKQR